jgi:acetylornithine deacetylase/succinyl-diaminopimelate desuccinylase-like protein
MRRARVECRIAGLCLFLLAWVSPALTTDRYPIDWASVNAETLGHFQALVRLDTSNPPGNETRAAEYVSKVFHKEGIPAHLLVLDPARANLVARVRGNGSKRPVLVMGHTDVVGVQREKWTVDPFGAERKDGYIWGRGTLDDKDNVTAGLMLLLLLKRFNVALDRDVIFLAEAGEEGFAEAGLKHVISNSWEEISAEFCLAEGGGGVIRDGRVHHVSVATAEKVGRGVRLVARGTAGHGSVPIPDNAVARLADAVAKIAAWVPAMRLNDTTKAYFERLAEVSPPEAAARYRALVEGKETAAAERYLKEHEPGHNSMLRTSISPTLMKAGIRTNVIPSEAEAYLDIRALPDEDMEKFLVTMREVIGDPKVEIKTGSWRPAAPASRLDTEMFAALEKTQKRFHPEAVTLPALMTGASDNNPLRLKGVQAYGIGPLTDEKGHGRGGRSHGDDERIREESLYDFVKFLWYAVLEVAASK